MTVPQSILDLIARFDENASVYCSPSYNETKLRIDFLNPLLEALGWDVANRSNHPFSRNPLYHKLVVNPRTPSGASKRRRA
jgi:hypothetical protein